VGGLSTHERWILRPLTDAGLTDEEVGTLLFRLAFTGAVDPAGPRPLEVLALVDGRPLPVRRAWLEVLDRMTAGPGADPVSETSGSRNQPAQQDPFRTAAPG
jgi:hypothetical protein